MLGYLMLAMFLGSCTVYENRDGCPSYLAVDLREVDNTIKEWQMWLFDEDGTLLLKDTIYRRSYQEPYLLDVPRLNNVKCLMWGNMRNATRIEENYSSRTYIEKMPGVWADSLYFFEKTVSTKGENSYVKVVYDYNIARATLESVMCLHEDFFTQMENKIQGKKAKKKKNNNE